MKKIFKKIEETEKYLEELTLAKYLFFMKKLIPNKIQDKNWRLKFLMRSIQAKVLLTLKESQLVITTRKKMILTILTMKSISSIEKEVFPVNFPQTLT